MLPSGGGEKIGLVRRDSDGCAEDISDWDDPADWHIGPVVVEFTY